MAIIGLLFLLPWLLIIALVIALDSKGGVFYTQVRVGRDNKDFGLFKFRTMVFGAEKQGELTIGSDARITSVGRFLRKYKLDEFPQLLNVLKGQINLIGPRPGLESQTELAQAREKLSIFDVKPGITGLAQVLGYDMENPIKLAEIDKVYITNKSATLDLVILIATFTSLPREYLSKKLDIMYLKKIKKN